MSTKIYTGFSWDTTDLPEMMGRLRVVQGILKTSCLDRKARALTHMAVERIDRACLALAYGHELAEAEKVRSPLLEADVQMQERQKAILSSGLRDADVDFEVRIALWFVPELNRFVGHVLAEDQGAAYRLVRRQAGVSDYRYWNNTDRPKAVSRKAWESREKVWREVLKGELGLPLVLTVDADRWIDRAVLSRRLPTHQTRVAGIAQDMAYARWCKHREAGESPKKPDSLSQYMRFRRQSREPDTQAAQLFDEEVQRVGRLLPRDVRSLLFSYDPARVPTLLEADKAKELV